MLCFILIFLEKVLKELKVEKELEERRRPKKKINKCKNSAGTNLWVKKTNNIKALKC